MRVALIGCGRIGKRHAEILTDMSSLVAVCDIVSGRAMEFAQEFTIPCYVGYDQMMQDTQPDVAVVATPSGMHAEHVLDLQQYGAMVVVEKPLALKADDLTAIKEAYKKGPEIYTVLQNRLNLPVAALRKALPRLGKLVLLTARVRWHRDQSYFQDWHGDPEMAGGVLLNQAIHHLDLLRWTGGPVESVFAIKTCTRDIAVDDVFIGTMKFKSGALGVIEATTAANANLEGSLSVLGENGTIEIGGFAVNEMKRFKFTESRPGDDAALKVATNPPDVYGFGHVGFWNLMRQRIDGGELVDPELLVPPSGAISSIQVALAMYRSTRLGKEVSCHSC